MLSRTPFTLSLMALCMSIALAVCAWAQTNTSRISGAITDSNGAVVSGAKGTAKHDRTGTAQTLTTTEAGLYSFPSLPVGSYTITVEMTGFKTANQAGVIIQVNTPTTVDIALEVGQASEIVNITGGAERLQTDNATIGNVV